MLSHAQDAAAAERGVEHFVAAGQRAGMGRGGFGGLLGAPGFDDDDRLGERDFARGGEEGARVAHRFHVHEDALRRADRRPSNR